MKVRPVVREILAIPTIREVLQKALDFGYDRGLNEAWNTNIAYKESQMRPTGHSVEDFMAALEKGDDGV